ncbi:MAG: hypothetical protein KKC46_14935 [Proteobacteria bacterium]|nr:hypothetical protein [Pseudomonadota bacterium]
MNIRNSSIQTINQQAIEPLSKRFSLVKLKTGDNFNRRNTLSISRIALKVSAYASLRVTSCDI